MFGVGHKTALRLIARGVSGVEQLRAPGAVEQLQLQGGRRPVLAPALVPALRRFLEMFDDLHDGRGAACARRRIPREEVALIAREVREAAAAAEPGSTAHACGSFRRGAADCGDVDVVVVPARAGQPEEGALARLVRRLEDKGLVSHLVHPGDRAYWGAVRRMQVPPAPCGCGRGCGLRSRG